jgi:cytochrome c biogenesis protein CcmG, thiol:disulfide interchange protein DsbE
LKRVPVKGIVSNKNAVIIYIIISFSVLLGQEQGNLAPTFYLTDLKGEDFFASKVYGDKAKEPSAIVLSFFATWCIPCRAEAPQLQILTQEFPGIQFYLVSVKDPSDKVLRWLNMNNVELPVLLDTYGKTAEKFGVIGNESNGGKSKTLPTLFVINGNGVIIYEHSGYVEGDEKDLKKILETLN